MPIIHVNHMTKIYVTNQNVTNKPVHWFGKTNKKKIYGVNNISFDIEKGETVGYIGLNGAGKSTTIKLLTGIMKPTEGNVIVSSFDPFNERKKLAKHIGVVFGQRNQLWWDLPLIDSFELLKEIYSVLNMPIRQLSLGQRMRGNLIASLLHNPDILFLDEPTLGLDIDSRHEFIEFIKSLKKNKITIFLTTHNMRDIEELCERIIILDKGQIIYDGDLSSIYDNTFGKYVIIAKVKCIDNTDLKFQPDPQGIIRIQARDEIEKEVIINNILKRCMVENISIMENNLEGYLLSKTGGRHAEI